MKRIFLAVILLLTVLLLAMACSNDNEIDNGDSNENSVNSEENYENEPNDEEGSLEENQDANDSDDNKGNGTEEQLSIRELSDLIIDALDNRDMPFLSQYVHPEKGLLFSPYIYVADDAVVFEKEAVPKMLDSDEVFDWGLYDGKGTPIELTPPEYFGEFLDMTPYKQVDQILIDDIQDRGNTINNVQEVFPEAEIIEFYNEGSEEYAGIDWSSVILVYEHDETGGLQLVAVVRDMWTI